MPFSQATIKPVIASEERLQLATFLPQAFQRSQREACFSIPLAAQFSTGQAETWAIDQCLEYKKLADIHASLGQDYACLQVQRSGPLHNMRAITRQCYQDLLAVCQELDYPFFVKFWNYVPAINQGAGDQETYKQFCVGRAEAMQSMGVLDEYVPAGTGVGCEQAYGLTVCALLGRQQPTAIENPRQISAYQYPRQYGPRSPSFSRATVLENASRRIMFLSGTAAIKGHESLHECDSLAQLQEIRKNLDAMLHNAGLPELSEFAASAHQNGHCMRLYVRPGDKQDAIIEQFPMVMPELAAAQIYSADICRANLLVELDGIMWSESPTRRPRT